MSGLLNGIALTPPLQPGRDEAARAAQDELAKGIYQAAQPSLLDRVIAWLQDKYSEFSNQVARSVPGGIWGLILLVLLVILVVVLIRWRVGGLARSATQRPEVFGGSAQTSAQYRAAADRAAAAGRFDEAVLERFRAVVRQLEERVIIDERAGRTADEAARDGGRMLPDCAQRLAVGADTFDDIAYGLLPARTEDDQAMRALDEAVRVARPVPVSA